VLRARQHTRRLRARETSGARRPHCPAACPESRLAGNRHRLPASSYRATLPVLAGPPAASDAPGHAAVARQAAQGRLPSLRGRRRRQPQAPVQAAAPERPRCPCSARQRPTPWPHPRTRPAGSRCTGSAPAPGPARRARRARGQRLPARPARRAHTRRRPPRRARQGLGERRRPRRGRQQPRGRPPVLQGRRARLLRSEQRLAQLAALLRDGLALQQLAVGRGRLVPMWKHQRRPACCKLPPRAAALCPAQLKVSQGTGEVRLAEPALAAGQPKR